MLLHLPLTVLKGACVLAAIMFFVRPTSSWAMVMGSWWFGLAAFAVLAMTVAAWAKRTKARLEADEFRHCIECGHSLVGGEDTGKCPECGAAYELPALVDAWRSGLKF